MFRGSRKSREYLLMCSITCFFAALVDMKGVCSQMIEAEGIGFTSEETNMDNSGEALS